MVKNLSPKKKKKTLQFVVHLDIYKYEPHFIQFMMLLFYYKIKLELTLGNANYF